MLFASSVPAGTAILFFLIELSTSLISKSLALSFTGLRYTLTAFSFIPPTITRPVPGTELKASTKFLFT